MSNTSTRILFGFIAGALSHVIFQGALGTLYFAVDMIPALPWSLKPLPPFGVPTTVNFAFWAGLWGIAYALLEPRLTPRVGRVAGPLQPLRREDLHEVAHVQARRGRVETDIEPHAPGRERLAQGAEVRRVCDQAAPHEVVEECRVDGAGHRRAFHVVVVSLSAPRLGVPSLPHADVWTPPGWVVRA